ncbi:MAG: DUF2148 domain-containing protein [Elusimicrobiales bacterium]|nr:DUF2148 domain-containing protein [Elusimicrobiales bacterium]
MTVRKEQELRGETTAIVARKMLLAARTAPKACGIDNIECALVDGADIEKLAEKMEELAKRLERPFFARDAQNLRNSECAVLIGTRISALGLDCGLCGFPACADKNKNPAAPCFFNANDLGIAVGSAAGAAMDCRADNRVMYTIGRAAGELGLLGPEIKIMLGIPLSASGKNPFFDRK